MIGNFLSLTKYDKCPAVTCRWLSEWL